MGIREAINKERKVAAVAATVLAVIGLGTAAFLLAQPDGARPPSGQAFYSTDDGRTWFPAPASNPSPFQKDGKPAYRVHVWRCEDGKEFVSHLERLAPESRNKLDELRAKAGNPQSTPPPPGTEAMLTRDVEVKDPNTGDRGWTRQSTPEGKKVTEPTCPEGSNLAIPITP